MIGVATERGWCVLVGGDDDPDGPSSSEISSHIARVSAQRCAHHAVTINGRVVLHTCPACSTD